MCTCGQCLEYVECECPTLSGVDAAQILDYITNIYTPAQSISGAGYTVTLYTNTSSSTQTVLIETNMYLIGTEATSVTTTTYLKNAVALTGAGVAVMEGTPLKTDMSHFLAPTSLPAGQAITINIAGSLGAPTLRWLKSVVYKY